MNQLLRSMRCALSLAIVLCASGYACSDDDVRPCALGATKLCTCEDGRQGASVCAPAGWGDCDCGVLFDDGGVDAADGPPAADGPADAPAGETPPDTSAELVQDLDPSACDGPGSCHPSGNGQACISGSWQMPPCGDPTFGCGATKDATVGFCDPRWSECLGPTTSYSTCDEYCASVGKQCDEVCLTSRNYPGWGAEAWLSAAACEEPTISGKGQVDCTAVLTGAKRWRCCCI